jgi:hypothetical protein
MSLKLVMLSEEDWAEIYYALETKAILIEAGQYGRSDRPAHNADWAAHLRAIMRILGPGAETVVAHGVAPLSRIGKR